MSVEIESHYTEEHVSRAEQNAPDDPPAPSKRHQGARNGPCCLCSETHVDEFMPYCSVCLDFFHPACVGMGPEEAEGMDELERSLWACPDCSYVYSLLRDVRKVVVLHQEQAASALVRLSASDRESLEELLQAVPELGEQGGVPDRLVSGESGARDLRPPQDYEAALPPGHAQGKRRLAALRKFQGRYHWGRGEIRALAEAVLRELSGLPQPFEVGGRRIFVDDLRGNLEGISAEEQRNKPPVPPVPPPLEPPNRPDPSTSERIASARPSVPSARTLADASAGPISGRKASAAAAPTSTSKNRDRGGEGAPSTSSRRSSAAQHEKAAPPLTSARGSKAEDPSTTAQEAPSTQPTPPSVEETPPASDLHEPPQQPAPSAPYVPPTLLDYGALLGDAAEDLTSLQGTKSKPTKGASKLSLGQSKALGNSTSFNKKSTPVAPAAVSKPVKRVQLNATSSRKRDEGDEFDVRDKRGGTQKERKKTTAQIIGQHLLLEVEAPKAGSRSRAQSVVDPETLARSVSIVDPSDPSRNRVVAVSPSLDVGLPITTSRSRANSAFDSEAILAAVDRDQREKEERAALTREQSERQGAEGEYVQRPVYHVPPLPRLDSGDQNFEVSPKPVPLQAQVAAAYAHLLEQQKRAAELETTTPGAPALDPLYPRQSASDPSTAAPTAVPLGRKALLAATSSSRQSQSNATPLDASSRRESTKGPAAPPPVQQAPNKSRGRGMTSIDEDDFDEGDMSLDAVRMLLARSRYAGTPSGSIKQPPPPPPSGSYGPGTTVRPSPVGKGASFRGGPGKGQQPGAPLPLSSSMTGRGTVAPSGLTRAELLLREMRGQA